MEPRILELPFIGSHNESRDSLLNIAKNRIMRFLKHKKHSQTDMFFTVIYEMVKNIFDHADGHGHVLLKDNGTDISFEVKDFGRETYDFEALKGKTTKNNPYNEGKGLTTITDLSNLACILLQIDVKKGFSYTGKWKYR